MAKLSDAEFTERTRAANRRRTARYQQRMQQSGKSALTVWIPDAVRTALTAAAVARGATIADTATALLSAALMTPPPRQSTPGPASGDADATIDMFGKPGPAPSEPDADPLSRVIPYDKDALMAEVGKMLDSRLSGGEIARRLNAAGYRTANGTEFIGANLLRDYRKWQKAGDSI